jgi:hypothetical protein
MINYLLGVGDLKISYEQLIRLWNACMVKRKGATQRRELIKVLDKDSMNLFFQDRECL